MQRDEWKWREMIDYLEGGRIPRSKYPRTTLDQFLLEEEILYLSKRNIDNTVRYMLVVPSELRKAALELIHCKESGHLGQRKSILKCEEYFYWPNLKSDVKRFVKECIPCQQYKGTKGLQKPWQQLPSVSKPLERISIDITDMGTAAHGYCYVLTIIDHFSRFTKFYKLRTRQMEEVCKRFRDYLGDFGMPNTVLLDNAREFTSQQFKELCERSNIQLGYITPYHPQGNYLGKNAWNHEDGSS